MIQDILTKIDSKDLIKTIGTERVRKIEALLGISIYKSRGQVQKKKLIQCLNALYGNNLLFERSIRQLIFQTMDPSALKMMAEKYCSKSYNKPYDNSLALSLIPWKFESTFVIEISKKLKIEDSYLPHSIQITPNIEEVEPISKYFKLHDYQEDLKEQIIQNLQYKTKRFLVQMPTGAGKTRTVLEAIIYYWNVNKDENTNDNILWLAHTEELCEQAIETFKNLWPHLSHRGINLCRIFGNHSASFADLRNSFIVGTLQKFSSLLKNSTLFLDSIKLNLSILLIDEAHKSTAKTYAKLISYLVDKQDITLVGITATPGRSKNLVDENKQLSLFFNKHLISPNISGNPIITLRQHGILSNLNRRVIESELVVKISKKESEEIFIQEDIPNSIIKQIENNVSRNKLIINTIMNEVKNGNPCLVFACSVEHCKILSAVLNYMNVISLCIDSKTAKSTRKNIIKEFKDGKSDVLINYGILSTGFDAPRIRTIIVARPTSSIVLYSQIIGRGLRGPKMGGAKDCNLIDIKDNFVNYGGIEEVYSYFEDYWKN